MESQKFIKYHGKEFPASLTDLGELVFTRASTVSSKMT